MQTASRYSGSQDPQTVSAPSSCAAFTRLSGTSSGSFAGSVSAGVVGTGGARIASFVVPSVVAGTGSDVGSGSGFFPQDPVTMAAAASRHARLIPAARR